MVLFGEGAIGRYEVLCGMRDACISPQDRVSCEWDIAEGAEGVICWYDRGLRESIDHRRFKQAPRALLDLHSRWCKRSTDSFFYSWEVTSGFPAAGVSPLNGAGVGAATSAYVFDSASGCDAGTGSIPAEPCASAPASPRSSHELDGETGHALLLSPRAFDSMDCLPTENLNSVSIYIP
jgi:hypothetical protein